MPRRSPNQESVEVGERMCEPRPIVTRNCGDSLRTHYQELATPSAWIGVLADARAPYEGALAIGVRFSPSSERLLKRHLFHLD